MNREEQIARAIVDCLREQDLRGQPWVGDVDDLSAVNIDGTCDMLAVARAVIAVVDAGGAS